MSDPLYESFMGLGPKRIAQWEHWSNPNAASYITGIDYYKQPRSCMLKLIEMYPFIVNGIGVPDTDDPIPTLEEQLDQGHGQWGGRYRDYWQQDVAEHRFKDLDEMMAFSPLEQADFRGWNVVVDQDFSSEEIIYQKYRALYPAEWDKAPEGSSVYTSFYNSMFMWPMLVFGYENFMLMSLMDGFDRIMDEFAEINRRVFRAFARLPVNFVVSHDDIVLPTGPVCSPEWMHKFIFPRYEEFWGIVKDSGKEVIFMVDGCVDAFADDVIACGARGITSEPFTNYKKLARKYENCFIAGEGDCRVLMRKDKAEIKRMVETMVETANMSGGYVMTCGNHIPFNVPGEAIKYYFDLCAEMGFRD